MFFLNVRILQNIHVYLFIPTRQASAVIQVSGLSERTYLVKPEVVCCSS